MLAVLCGILCGTVQFLLLKKFTCFLLSGKTKPALLLLAAKLAVYAAVLTIVLVFFAKQAIFFITGLAGVLILGTVLQYIRSRR
jgi:hypothetical protein